MKSEERKNRKGIRRVTFNFYAPRAREVQLMGDFNKWGVKPQVMKKNNYGIWSKTTYLFPGSYEYLFLADGNWNCDPRNPNRCPNCFGTENNVIQVKS